MDKSRFVTIFPTFESLDVVRETLPTVVEETRRAGARLIVHDASVRAREEKWAYLREVCRPPIAFLMLTDPISMAHARNTCLRLAAELYCPEYICMLEDDHGYRPGFIDEAVRVMARWYGERAPNGLRFGLFTGCNDWPIGRFGTVPVLDEEGRETGHLCPSVDEDPGPKGGTHNGCRIAPTHHWLTVLRGYDADEYPISRFQTSVMGFRNYHRGFTKMIVGGGRDGGGGVFMVQREGHGVTGAGPKRWDDAFCASDTRARYEPTPGLAGAADAHDGERRLDSDWTREGVQGLFPVLGR